MIEREEQFYVLCVSGLPARLVQGSAEEMKEKALLKRRDKTKPPIRPADVQVRAQRRFADVYLLFPKTDPITLEDREVEFVLEVKNLEIKKKFKLKDMVYKGKLEI